MEKELKERVRSILNEYGLNPTQLAERYGLNQKTLNNHINGDTAMPVSTILLILDAIPEISAEWILRGNGDKIRPDSTSPNNKYYFFCNKILELEGEKTKLFQQLATMMEKE